ncbi:MAG TPA: CotH kinase family protein [Polyangiaceae bacterium]|nr:CotH kinase family protein [Polyangiaceae bacterium]
MRNVSTRWLVVGWAGLVGVACGASPDAAEGAPAATGMPSSDEDLPSQPGAAPGAGGGGQSNGTGSESSPSPSETPLLPDTVPDSAADPASQPAPSLTGDIRFSEPSGSFEGSLSVGLETSIEGAVIRFTLDGSVPGPGSPVYSSPLGIDQTRQVRAQAFVGDAAAGNPGTALYVARTFDATSDLPLLVLEGYGGGKPIDREVYADMALLVYEPVAGVAALSQTPTLATRGGYHLRGQSSAMFEQAPYRIELWDNASEDIDLPLLGMPAEGDWALVGPYSDRSLIRNAFVYDLGRDMGVPAPRYAFAEVYINQADRALQPSDYQGIYMVVETIKNNRNRLDLAQLEPEDVGAEQISGGYIFKFEWAASEEPTLDCSGSAPLGGGGFGFPGGFPSAPSGPGGGAPGGGGPGGGAGTCWTDLEVVDPEPLAPEQAEFLTAAVQQFHDALHAEPFAVYSQYIDVPSFVDLFIISELTRNLDAYTRSAYYYKDRGGLITAGPLWDYNLTLGMGFGTNLEVVGWQFEERNVASDWFRILGTDPAFLERVSARWRELRTGLLSEAQLDARVDALAAPLANAAVRDFERWPVADVAQGIFQIPSDPTWEGQLSVISEWTRERLAWLDSQLGT